jgi:hypothetical protein
VLITSMGCGSMGFKVVDRVDQRKFLIKNYCYCF